MVDIEILVIGGGPAGTTAALRASELGKRVILVERGRMGGTCTNDGCAPTRVLAKAARLVRDSRQMPEYGLVGPEPTLDFSALMARTQQVVYRMQEKKQLLHILEEAGVVVRSEVGEARFIDPHRIELPGGEQIRAEQIIICAGGRSRRLDFPGADLAMTHSHIWSLEKLPRSLVVAGAAATGCQLASIFDAFGCQVTLLELAPRILAGEDEAISSIVQTGFEQRGIRVVTGIGGIEGIQKTEAGLEVRFKTGDGVETLTAEGVVLSAGWVGNLDPLNLPAAGVETRGPYIQVDDHLRTSAGHIYAAGDITGRMMLVQTAGSAAVVAAENACLGPARRWENRIVPHGGFTDPEYGSVGLTEAKAREAGLDYIAWTVPYADMDRAVIDGHTEGLCKLIVSRENHRILGAHVAGEQALEVVHAAAAGMAADMWVEQLAELEIAYPTFTAILGLAARKIMTELGVKPLARSWRALGRSHVVEWEKPRSS